MSNAGLETERTTGAATSVATIDTEHPALARAKRIHAENRALTREEGEQARADSFSASQSGDTLLERMLGAVYMDIEKRADYAAAMEQSRLAIAAAEKISQFARDKPKRWAALSQQERAAFIIADEFDQRIGQAFMRYVELTNDEERTAQRQPANAFEPSVR